MNAQEILSAVELASGLDDLTIICAVLVAAQLILIVLSVVAVSDFIKWRKERKK